MKSITIVFDEGQDTAPDNFGLAVLDNIDVNGTLVGNHEANNDNGEDKGNGNDNQGHHKDHKGHQGDPDDAQD